MSTTEPIRDRKTLQNFKDYYRSTEANMRNYTIIIIGLNTALRISDILHLTHDAVYKNGSVKEHIVVREQKTGKENRVLLNHEARTALAKYHKTLVKTKMYQDGNPYLFPSPKKNRCAAFPFSGIPHDYGCRQGSRHRGTHQLPLPAQDLRLPRMETGKRAGCAHGYFQPLILCRHKTLPVH